MDESVVRKVVKKVVKGLDEEMEPYVVTMITESEATTPEELSETLFPILESYGLADNEKAALKVAKKMARALEKEGVSLAGAPMAETSSKLLDAPVNMGESKLVDDGMLDFLW